MLASRRGDTLIEVLFAVAVFSAIAIGAMVIMNKGINAAQTALEINLVRNQIDTQAQLLHQMNDAKLTSLGRGSSQFAQQWNEMVSGSSNLLVPYAQDYNTIQTFEDCSPDSDHFPSKAFFIDPQSGEIVRGQSHFAAPGTFAQIRLSDNPSIPSTSEMIWIQVVDSSSEGDGALSNTRSYDFHIRACWDSPGSDTLMKIGTIVRMYAPKES